MHKVGDCFYCPLTNSFMKLDSIEGTLYTLMYEHSLYLGQLWEQTLIMYLDKGTFVKLKDDTPNERLLIRLKHGR